MALCGVDFPENGARRFRGGKKTAKAVFEKRRIPDNGNGFLTQSHTVKDDTMEYGICPHCGGRIETQRPKPRWEEPRPVTVVLEPKGGAIAIPKAKSALQVLKKLGLRPTAALVVRNGELLTPDRSISPGDELRVRVVMSSG